MNNSIDIKVSIDKQDVESIALILEKTEELNDLIPGWNKLEADKLNDEIYHLLTKKFLQTEDVTNQKKGDQDEKAL